MYSHILLLHPFKIYNIIKIYKRRAKRDRKGKRESRTGQVKEGVKRLIAALLT
jgi:hypothetical protein